MSDDVVLTWILATPNGKPYTTTIPRELWEEQDQAALINQLGAGLLDHMRMADGRGAVVLTAMVNEGPVPPGEEATPTEGDPDTRCGDPYRTEYHGVARCSRGLGHVGVHAGHADDGTTCQWSADEPTA